MEVALLAAAPGFNVSCASLCSTCTGSAKTVVATLVKNVFAEDQTSGSGLDLQALQQEFAAAQCVITVGQVQQWAAAISFVKAAALKHKPSAEELFAQLQESTELGPSVSKIVARQYALFGSTESGAASSAGESAPGVMSTGKLVDAQWSIGATLGHSLRLNNSMDAPQTPLVSLNLAVCSAGGEVQRTPLTLTVSEFRQLHKQLKDAASAMEGL